MNTYMNELILVFKYAHICLIFVGMGSVSFDSESYLGPVWRQIHSGIKASH